MGVSNTGTGDTPATDLTAFTIKVDGEALPGTVSVVAVDITREVNRVPRATLVLYDGDAATQDFEVSSGETLVPGGAIEIEAGYGTEQEPLFAGVITGQRISVKRGGESLLHIEARDACFRMTMDPRSAYYVDLSDSELLEEVVGRYPDLTAEVEATSTTHPEIVQYAVTDWDFVVSRVERIGMCCFPEDGTFRVGRPELEQEPVSTLAYGINVFDMDLEMDSRSQYQKITAEAWDPARQEVVSADIEDVPVTDLGNIGGPDLATVGGVENFELPHSGTLAQEELDAWAEAGMIKSRFARIRGTIRCQGSEALRPGTLVKLEGMGDRFNGTAFVSGVRHMLGGGDWESVVQLGLRPEWHHERFAMNAAPASGFNPAISGLHVGVVTQLQDDPAGEDRVLVRVPLIDAAADGVWSRLATLDAGDNRGSVFRPEIGDEVVVGFVNADPNQSVVLGMVHSSSKSAPIVASDDNHEKGFVTRSGMKVVFDDDTVATTIETPNGNKIVVDDSEGHVQLSDEAGNKLTMSADGITMESAKDIILKATGDITVEGMNTSVKASGSAAVEGSAGASLNSSGSTEVKGSLVRIN